jgi:DNA invertase Pin-like site-specific DNA recombinase
MGFDGVKKGVRTMRIVGYVRVSSEDQAREGVSLDAQREKVRLFAKLHGYELVDAVTDAGVSAKTLERPGLTRVLKMLDEGEADGVVVVKLDRLTRSVSDLAVLLDRYFGEAPGKQLFSVGDSINTLTAAGRLVLNVLMSVSQWERETIVERTRSAMTFKKGRGERVSRHIPYGRRLAPDGKTLEPDLAETALAEEVRRWREGGMALRAIAAELSGRRVPTKNGGPWTFSAVRSLLKHTA